MFLVSSEHRFSVSQQYNRFRRAFKEHQTIHETSEPWYHEPIFATKREHWRAINLTWVCEENGQIKERHKSLCYDLGVLGRGRGSPLERGVTVQPRLMPIWERTWPVREVGEWWRRDGSCDSTAFWECAKGPTSGRRKGGRPPARPHTLAMWKRGGWVEKRRRTYERGEGRFYASSGRRTEDRGKGRWSARAVIYIWSPCVRLRLQKSCANAVGIPPCWYIPFVR